MSLNRDNGFLEAYVQEEKEAFTWDGVKKTFGIHSPEAANVPKKPNYNLVNFESSTMQNLIPYGPKITRGLTGPTEKGSLLSRAWWKGLPDNYHTGVGQAMPNWMPQKLPLGWTQGKNQNSTSARTALAGGALGGSVGGAKGALLGTALGAFKKRWDENIEKLPQQALPLTKDQGRRDVRTDVTESIASGDPTKLNYWWKNEEARKDIGEGFNEAITAGIQKHGPKLALGAAGLGAGYLLMNSLFGGNQNKPVEQQVAVKKQEFMGQLDILRKQKALMAQQSFRLNGPQQRT